MSLSYWIRTWRRSLERRWALHQALRRQQGVRCRATRLRLESLEDRCLLSITYTVTSSGDTNTSGTLRFGINQANNPANGITEIDFDVNDGGAQTITLASQLPTLTASGVTINGLSQGGNGNTTQLITLNGSGAGSKSDGLLISGSNCQVSGLVIEDFTNNGIEVDGSGNTIGGTATGSGNIMSGNQGLGNTGAGVLIDSVSGVFVEGNDIGTNTAGTAALANSVGVFVNGSNNTIGGSVAGAGNLISGNITDGILINTNITGISVLGNSIGTDVTGENAVANNNGILDNGANNNTIGGTSSAARNIISGNTNAGVQIGLSTGVLIEGNYIGTDVSGTKGVANNNGISVGDGGNTIGGTATGAGNLISGNTNDGVLLDAKGTDVTVQGNYIGTDDTGANAVANSIGVEIAGSTNTIGGAASGARNIISGNDGDGLLIDSSASGVSVQGNYIGTDATGTEAVANYEGVFVDGESNTIGGAATGARNIISGNSNDGVFLDGSFDFAQVLGNYIGTDASGTKAVANIVGVEDSGITNTIGGDATGARNIISGNSDEGVVIDSSASGVQVQGNYIGTDATGAIAVPNRDGIDVEISTNTIGGIADGAGNVISGNSGYGVDIWNFVSGVTVQGNYVGTDATGAKALANYSGVYVYGPNNTIGGTTTAARNVISGNIHEGVVMQFTDVTVQGNYIGTDATGTKAVGNSVGIEVGATTNTIGGTTTGAGNVISGNSNDGVLIDSQASGVQVQGNSIGTDSTGSKTVPNGTDGVFVSGLNNTIGGSVANAANIIANNAGGAVCVSSGNGTTIRLNSIFANNGSGIFLNNGGNNNLAAPSLSSASMSQNTLTVMGSFTPPKANVSYTLDFYANSSGDAEGRVYLGSLTVTPTSSNPQSFAFATATTVTSTDLLITATLTDASGNTSQFSGGVTTSGINVYEVTSTADDGRPGTLRDAIIQANASGSSITEIDFYIGTSGSAQTINLTSDLPALTANGVLINGLSQGGTTPLITLNGTTAGSGSDGLFLQGSDCTVLGLIVEDFTRNGIEVANSDNTIGGTASGAGNVISGNGADGVLIHAGVSGVSVLGNSIGTNLAGTKTLANIIGIEVAGTSNTLGSTHPAARNIISGNSQDGLLIDSGASGNVVLGNYVGVNYDGLAALHNSIGIEVAGTNNTIGGTATGSRNIVSGNSSDGVLLDSNASGNLVLGNYVGINGSGTAALGNGVNGIELAGISNTLGGTAQPARNVVSANGNDGVLLDSGASGNQLMGNYIGTDTSGMKALANKVGIEDAGNNNTLGGSVLGCRMIVSGNSGDGVLLDSGTADETVQGNFMGLNEKGLAALANGGNGVEIKSNGHSVGGDSGSNYFVRNFLTGNGNDGILIDSGATGNQVQGNFIGLDLTGTNAVGNVANGIEIVGNSNTIGSATSANTNFISGNKNDGILLDSAAAANVVEGNDVGTNYTGRGPADNSVNGIEVMGAGNTLGGSVLGAGNVISGNSNDGVLIDSNASGTLVEGNTIGINATAATGTNGVYGVSIAGHNNTVGGTTYYARNIIAGNTKAGVLLGTSASGNLLLGNLIGVNVSGNGVANSVGVEVAGTNNTLGGVASGSRNIISDNSHAGALLDSTASGNVVLGNYIGTNLYGSAALGNGSNGIEVAGGGNTLGGTSQPARNVIAASGNDGVLLDSIASGNQVLGNYLGTDTSGLTALANQVGIEDAGNNNTLGGSVLGARNVISGNTGDGVLLDSGASAETVQGNFMGLNEKGTAALANGINGLEVKGSNNTIGGNSGSNYFTRNFLTGNGNDGVLIDSGGSGNQVLGNFIGVDISGTNGLGNVGNGVEIAGSGNSIGGTTTGLGNTISGGREDGVLLGSTATGNLVQGNDIGTDYTGRSAVGNSSNGIEVIGVNNTLGCTTAGAGNTIASNSNNGVQIDSGASGTLVQGNYIGTNAAGGSLGNGSNGISIASNNNIIGGNAYRAANTIAHNSGDGVLVSIGTRNSLLRNSIYANSGLGISLTNGGNNKVAAPTLLSASSSSSTLTVTGNYTVATANVSYVLEFFANPTGDAEGKIYLGTLTLTPTSTGTQSFKFITSTTVTGTNPVITATLTDPSGNTSAFSNGVSVV